MTGAPSEAGACDLHKGSTPVPVPPSHHGHDLKHWPLRDSLPLGALSGAVPSARAHVQQLLWEWGRAELSQDVGLVVSELVGNAVKASTGLGPAVAPMLLWVGSDTRTVLVAVADTSPQAPMRLNPDPDAEQGRGLALVEAFSNRWGWHRTPAARLQKAVWAEWHPSPALASGQEDHRMTPESAQSKPHPRNAR